MIDHDSGKKTKLKAGSCVGVTAEDGGTSCNLYLPWPLKAHHSSNKPISGFLCTFQLVCERKLLVRCLITMTQRMKLEFYSEVCIFDPTVMSATQFKLIKTGFICSLFNCGRLPDLQQVVVTFRTGTSGPCPYLRIGFWRLCSGRGDGVGLRRVM